MVLGVILIILATLPFWVWVEGLLRMLLQQLWSGVREAMAVAPAPRRCLGIFRGRLPLLAVVPMILYFSRCRRVATGCDG